MNRSGRLLLPLLRCGFILGLLTAHAPAAGWSPNLTATTTWQDNVANADRRSDLLGALALSSELTALHRLALTGADAVTFGGHLAGETFPRFDGLDHATIGLRSAWLRKSGLGAQAPLLSATFSADAIAARESARSGFAAALTLSYRQRFGDATLLRLSQDFSRLDACGAVFDRTGAETSLAVTQTLNEAWQFGAAGRLRFGDVLSYGTPPRPDLVALARVRTPVDTFDHPMVAYSFSARTLSAGLSLTRRLGDRTALTFATEYRTTEKSNLRYANRLVSATVAHDF